MKGRNIGAPRHYRERSAVCRIGLVGNRRSRRKSTVVAPARTLSVGFGRHEGTVVVSVAGEVDVGTAPILGDALEAVIDDQGNLSVCVDLAGMTFIDSTGLSVLVGALKRLRERGGHLTLANPSATTLRVLEIVGLTRVLEIATLPLAPRPPATA